MYRGSKTVAGFATLLFGAMAPVVAQSPETLVVGVGQPMKTPDFVGVADPSATTMLAGNVNEALTRIAYDADGKIVWRPLLATSWERIDPLRWRFKIREGVKFSNGKPLTAADVAYSINKLVRPTSERSVINGELEKAEVVDDHTVDVITKRPSNFVDRAVYRIGIQPEGWGDTNPDEARTTAIGTGPYVLKSFDAATANAVIERAPEYWGEKSGIDRVEMRFIPEVGARMAALRAGEIDIAHALPPELVAIAPANLSTFGLKVEYLRIDTNKPLLDKVEVRQALNMAINRDALIQGLRSGQAELPKAQIVPPQTIGYDPSLDDYPFDPVKAREILKAAGAEGIKIGLMCQTELYGTLGSDSCNAVAQMLKDVGLDASVQILSFQEWRDTGLNAPGKKLVPPDLFYINSSTDAMIAAATMHQWFDCKSSRNTYCDPALEAAMAEADKATPDQEDAAWRKVMKIVHDAAPMLWLTVPTSTAATQVGIKGIVYPLILDDAYWQEWSRSDG